MDKKLLLSSFLIALFAIYVLAQHNILAVPFYNAGKNTTTVQPYPGDASTLPPTQSIVPASPYPGNASSSSLAAQPIAATANATQQKYRDGQYMGSVQDAYYGNVQVEATIQGGQIMAVDFLQYPNTHGTSIYINSQAMPMLKSEAIQAQSSKVDILSGATFTSQAYQASLADALSQATG